MLHRLRSVLLVFCALTFVLIATTISADGAIQTGLPYTATADTPLGTSTLPGNTLTKQHAVCDSGTCLITRIFVLPGAHQSTPVVLTMYYLHEDPTGQGLTEDLYGVDPYLFVPVQAIYYEQTGEFGYSEGGAVIAVNMRYDPMQE